MKAPCTANRVLRFADPRRCAGPSAVACLLLAAATVLGVAPAALAVGINEWHAINGYWPDDHPGFYVANPEQIDLSGGVLDIDNVGSGYPGLRNYGSSLSNRMFPDDAFDAAEDYAVEFDMRVVSLSGTWGGTQRVIADDGARHVNVSWIGNPGDYKVALFNEGSGTYLAQSDPAQFDVTQFHAYVLEKKLSGSGTGQIVLYADGQPLLSAPYENFSATSVNRLFVGIGSGSGDGHTLWRSLRYNPTDTLLPTPGPIVQYVASAAEPLKPDEVTSFPWQYYPGSASPPAPTPTFVDHALRLEVQGGSQYSSYFREEPDVLLPDGTPNNFIIEWRMKLMDDAVLGPRVKVDEDQGYRIQCVIRDGEIGLVPEGTGGGSALWDYTIDTTEWHTYRMIRVAGADLVDLFVDDMTTPLLSMANSDFGKPSWLTRSEVWFGWSNSGAVGWADFQYVRYQIGSTAFVPEPTSWILLMSGGLGLLTLWRQRRPKRKR